LRPAGGNKETRKEKKKENGQEKREKAKGNWKKRQIKKDEGE
jgi:hypothetical protein